MSSDIPEVVERYLCQIERDEPRQCKYQHALAAYVRRVFEDEELTVDTEQLGRYMSLSKYFPFKVLFPWEAFCMCLWLCTYTEPNVPRWPDLFCFLGRGAGKDGFIAFASACLLSPYNPVPSYDVDICAYNEEQAMRPVKDLIDVLETPQFRAKLDRHYQHTKEGVKGIKNKGEMRGRTNNAKGKDGMRSGCVIFNEVHRYENYENIAVFTTGLGKKDAPRRGIFSSNGKVSDGPFDDYVEQAKRILYEGEPDNGFLPFLTCLDAADEVHDERNWHKANPSLQYMPALMTEIRKEYREWKITPEKSPDFMPKRFGVRVGSSELAVTDYEKILATKKALPDLRRRSCTVGVDYAELSDWAAIDLHFKIGNERYDINHAWICGRSKTLERIKPNWRKWVEDGHCTFVDDVSISPELLAEYIREAGTRYNIRGLAMDNYRWTLVAEAFKNIGFDANDKSRVKLVRPSDIMKTEPVIQQCFDNGRFTWGDNPCLRWATNNTKRVPASKKLGSDTGNFYYAKIEAKSRKTDPFMALVAAMTIEPMLGSGGATSLPPIGAFSL